MTSQNGRAFNEWLRAQLKAKKMSQRQLAQQSGVDHSTISRLIRGDRMPSLGTATKLARGLRELRDDADTPQYLGLVAAGPPTRPPASSTPFARTSCCPSRRSARSWSTTSPCACAATAATYPVGRPPAPARQRAAAPSARSTAAGTGGRPMSVGGANGDRRRRNGRHGHGREHRPLRSREPPAGSPAATRALSRARPGSPSTVRVSGTANAGVWGAGVRDSRQELGRRRRRPRRTGPGRLRSGPAAVPTRSHRRPARPSSRPARRSPPRSPRRNRSSHSRTRPPKSTDDVTADGSMLPGASPLGTSPT